MRAMSWKRITRVWTRNHQRRSAMKTYFAAASTCASCPTEKSVNARASHDVDTQSCCPRRPMRGRKVKARMRRMNMPSSQVEQEHFALVDAFDPDQRFVRER